MFGHGVHGAERGWIAVRRIRRDSCRRDAPPLDGCFKERARSRRSASVAQIHVDDLTVLIDRPNQVALASANFEIRLVDPPPTTNWGAMRARCLNEAWRKARTQS